MTSPPAGATYNFAWTVVGVGFPYSSPARRAGTGADLFAFTPPRAGTYQVSVTVSGTDGTGASATQNFSVTGNPPGGLAHHSRRRPVFGGDAGQPRPGVSDGRHPRRLRLRLERHGAGRVQPHRQRPESRLHAHRVGRLRRAADRHRRRRRHAPRHRRLPRQHVQPVPVITSGPGTGSAARASGSTWPRPSPTPARTMRSSTTGPSRRHGRPSRRSAAGGAEPQLHPDGERRATATW